MAPLLVEVIINLVEFVHRRNDGRKGKRCHAGRMKNCMVSSDVQGGGDGKDTGNVAVSGRQTAACVYFLYFLQGKNDIRVRLRVPSHRVTHAMLSGPLELRSGGGVPPLACRLRHVADKRER